MKYLLTLLGGIAIGYWGVTKVKPYYLAKVESFDLDHVWEIWDDEEWMG